MIHKRFFQEVFVHEIYKPVRDLGQVNTVIDLGGCTGEFSLWVYPQAEHIYAIEGDKEAFESLKENLSDFPNVSVHNIALGDRNRTGHMTTGASLGGKSLSLDETATPEDIQVKTLATFMKEEGIEHVNVLKVDIEGGEDAIFNDPEFEDVADKIDFIIGEHLGGVTERLIKLGFNYEHHGSNVTFERKKYA